MGAAPEGTYMPPDRGSYPPYQPSYPIPPFKPPKRHKWRKRFLVALAVLAGFIVVIVALGSGGSKSSPTVGKSAPAASSHASASTGQYTLRSCYQVMPLVAQAKGDLASGDYEAISSLANDATTYAEHDGALNATHLVTDLGTMSIDGATLSLDQGAGSSAVPADQQTVQADITNVTQDCHT